MTEMISPAAAAEPPTIDRFSFEQGSINEGDVFFTKKALTPRMVAANCAGGICGGFTGGVSFGIIVLYFAIWFGSLDFNPLQSAFIGLGIFLIVVGIFLTCGCCYGGYRLRAARKARAGSPLGRARSSSEASRRERAVDRRRIKFGVGCCSLAANPVSGFCANVQVRRIKTRGGRSTAATTPLESWDGSWHFG